MGRLCGFRRGNGRSLGDGGGFGGRFSFSPNDCFALEEGEGPRTSGFFIAWDWDGRNLVVRSFFVVAASLPLVMQNSISHRSQGAEVIGDGVRYRTWAPGKSAVAAVIRDIAGTIMRTVCLTKDDTGYFSGVDERGRAGDLYQYRFDERDWPDPASRFNPAGVHGPAVVIDPRDYEWHDAIWRAPALADLVLHELHIGTFTPAGTFRGAIEKLDHLVELGVNALEIMPVADFPGARNWGYDGVLLYAPARVYGSPNDFRAFVDAAHGRGLAVVLDVVYNHLGPDGNYLGSYSRNYFNPAHKTPWGDAFNFELGPVRQFFLENPDYWRREFHLDGFRLDATHAIMDSSPQHFLAEVAERVHSLGGFVTVEDERNEPELLLPPARGGLGLDACWADDFHHVVRVMVTGAREGYYRFYEGTPEELRATVRDGWFLHGADRKPSLTKQPNEIGELPPAQFVFCIMNHDQIGNQAFGRRLNQKVSGATYRAASALLCLAPYTPLLFMGQEWAASSPFQFFTDHEPDLGRKITAGRREEFRGFVEFRDATMRAQIPDPQAEGTFLRSKLRWEEVATKGHAPILLLYRELLRLRRTLPALQDRQRENWQVSLTDQTILRLEFGLTSADERCLVLADLVGGHANLPEENGAWKLVLSTNEKRFGGEATDASASPEVRVLTTTGRD